MSRIIALYPPGPMYQRGEDRSQGNIENSTATSIRAANDLGYVSSMLKKNGHEVKLRDYQTESLTLEDLLSDTAAFEPDYAFLSITNSTIHDDIRVVQALKKTRPACRIILKGALFFDAGTDVLERIDLDEVDILIGGESDFVIADVISALEQNDINRLSKIGGIFYRHNREWNKTDFSTWNQELNSLAFPDRNSMKNELYKRPDTGEAQATISTSRGCGAKCTYCLTPVISGTRIRYRDPDDIFDEISQCYYEHGIRNFFFKSDTFTMNRHWVEKLCNRLSASELGGKIEWVANSRVNPLQQETLDSMRQSGCWLVAYGFESGSAETLRRIRKGATIEQNIAAREMTLKAGLKCFGFFMIGLPWEDRSHLEETRKHIFDLNCNFMELHIAVPYYGTQLYKDAVAAGVLADTPLGKDYFNSPTTGTIHLAMPEIEAFRKQTLLKFHLRTSYVVARLREAATNPKILANYSKFAYRLAINNLRN